MAAEAAGTDNHHPLRRREDHVAATATKHLAAEMPCDGEDASVRTRTSGLRRPKLLPNLTSALAIRSICRRNLAMDDEAFTNLLDALAHRAADCLDVILLLLPPTACATLRLVNRSASAAASADTCWTPRLVAKASPPRVSRSCQRSLCTVVCTSGRPVMSNCSEDRG